MDCIFSLLKVPAGRPIEESEEVRLCLAHFVSSLLARCNQTQAHVEPPLEPPCGEHVFMGRGRGARVRARIRMRTRLRAMTR